jgi:hypothetical protein
LTASLRSAQLARLARLVGPDPAPAPEDRVDAALAHLALEEGVGPRLGARVAAGLVQAASDEVAAELLRQHQLCVAKSIFLDRALARVAAALATREIPGVLLKGAALVRRYYDDGERPMGDLDLLVPASRWSDARAALEDARVVLFDPYDRPLTALHDYAVPMITPERVGLELHRYLSSRPLFAVDYDGFVARAERCPDGLLVPSPPDLFLSLAVHAGKHGFTLPFRSLIDGLVLAARAPLDPAEIAVRAQRWRASRATAGWILLLRRFGGLTDAGWDRALSTLSTPRSLQDMIDQAPWSEAGTDGAGWNQVTRILRSLDSVPRRLAFVAQRIGFRAADAVSNRLRSA